MEKTDRICNFRRMGIALTVALSLLVPGEVFALEVFYSVADDHTELSWDNVDAWKNAYTSEFIGALPRAENDNVTLNSSKLAIPNMLRITNGVYATAKRIGLGTEEVAAGRKIGLKVEAGGMLHTTVTDYTALSLGSHTNGCGILTIAGGTVSNRFITVGAAGTGVLTNDSGRIVILGDSGSKGNMNIGLESCATGTVVMTGGSITPLQTSDGWNHAIITVGASGHGTFEMSGGVISNRMVVGTSRTRYEGCGTGVFRMTGGLFDNRLFIGTSEGADDPAGTGIAEILEGGTVDGHLYVGNRGTGTLVIDGGTVKVPRMKKYGSNSSELTSAGMYVGRFAGSQGRFVFKKGMLSFTSTDANLVVGHEGVGMADIFSYCEVPYLRIGGSSSGSVYTLHDGVTNMVTKTFSIGGYVLNDDGSTNEYFTTGSGEFVISNALVKLTYDTSKLSGTSKNMPQLYVGRYEDSFGVIRGSGTFQSKNYAHNDPVIRMLLGNGQIIGDGFGSESVLDMHTFASVTNAFTNPADGTNGWYAVNKGAVLFPRRWTQNQNFFGVLGSSTTLTTPDMVNSVGYSVTRSGTDQIVICGGVYAIDRSDLNLDSLPSSDNIVGVWKLGSAQDVTSTAFRDFTSIDLTFRYDHTKTTAGRGLKLYRWTGSAWSKVASSEVDLFNPRIAVTGITPLSSSSEGIYRIGEFALVEEKPGLVIIVK